MTKEIRITDPRHLNLINDIVHDEWFYLHEVEEQKSFGNVCIPFVKESLEEKKVMRSWFVIHEIEIPRFRWCLQIGQVEELRLVDPNRVSRYDFNKIQFDDSNRCVTILTGIPLHFSLVVGSLDILLVRSIDPVGYRISKQLSFEKA